jgi:hypothetical protein
MSMVYSIRRSSQRPPALSSPLQFTHPVPTVLVDVLQELKRHHPSYDTPHTDSSASHQPHQLSQQVPTIVDEDVHRSEGLLRPGDQVLHVFTFRDVCLYDKDVARSPDLLLNSRLDGLQSLETTSPERHFGACRRQLQGDRCEDSEGDI